MLYSLNLGRIMAKHMAFCISLSLILRATLSGSKLRRHVVISLSPDFSLGTNENVNVVVVGRAKCGLFNRVSLSISFLPYPSSRVRF